MNLVHLIVRQWRQRPGRTILSILSVAIAAAAVLGIAVAQETVRLGYRQLLEVTEGRPALEIVSHAGGRFPLAEVPAVSDVPGVVASTPIVARATIARAGGKKFRAVMLGIPPDDAALWKTLPLESGEPLKEPDQALVSAELAEGLGIKLGDRLVVLARRGPRSATIVGLVNSASLREVSAAATLVVPLATLQDWFGLDDRVDRLRVLLASTDDRDAAQAAIASRLPAEFVVQSPVDQMELAGTILRSTELALQFAGALSMAMAGFIVLNTLRMNFGERRRDMAVLRVLGVTDRQLIRLHLFEGLCLGAMGAVLGTPLGLVLGRGLSAVMQKLGKADVSDPEIPYGTITLALVVGPLVACAAALVPALQSRKVSAGEALGNTEARHAEHFPLWAVVGGVALWSVACVLLLLVVFEHLAPESAIPAGVLMLVGFIAVIPLLMGPVIRAVARLISPITQMEGGFAADQLLQRPTRTGLTVGVLVVAVSTSMGLGNAILSNVNDVRAWYRRTFSGDLVVMGSQSAEPAGAESEGEPLRRRLTEVAGVKGVVEVRHLPTRVNGVPAMCIVRDFLPDAALPWQVTPAEADQIRADLDDGKAVMGNILARRLGLAPGDEVRLELQGRTIPVRVPEFVRDYTAGGLVLFMQRAAAAKLVEVEPPDLYVIISNADTPIDQLAATIRPIVREEGLALQSFAQLRQTLDSLINGIVGALWGLLVIGFVVGGIAVGNTLTMSVLEQTRELGLLRVIGMTRRQARKLIFCESVLLGILGVVMGTAAGLTTAFVIHLCNEPLMGQSIPFSLHAWLVGVSAAGGLVIVMLAAWLPGERAARLNLLEAIACE